MNATIAAIAGLWPFVLSVAALILAIAAVMNRKGIGKILERTTSASFEKGDIKANIALNNATKTEESPGKEEDSAETSEKEIAENTKVENKEVAKIDVINVNENEKIEVSKFILWLNAMHERDYIEADKLYKDVEIEEVEKKSDAAKRLAALKLRLKYENGDSQSLNQLIDMAKNDNTFFTLYSVGLCYIFASDHRRGIEYLNLSLTRSEDDDDTANAIVVISKNMRESNNKGRIAYLTSFLNKIHKDSAKYIIYKAIADLYEKLGNKVMTAMILQKCAQLSLNDSSAYFDAGYAFAEADIDSLARENYISTLAFSKKNAMAVNNLAVSEHNLGLSFSSVVRYKSSMKDGETLATANLIYRLIDAGFQEEAEALIAEAKQQKELHPNVLRAEVKLRESIEEEDKKIESIKKSANITRTFAWDFADAIANTNLIPDNSRWRIDGLDMTIRIEGSSIYIDNSEGNQSNSMKGSILGNSFTINIVNTGYTSAMRNKGFTSEAKVCGYFKDDKVYIFISKDKADQKVVVGRIANS